MVETMILLIQPLYPSGKPTAKTFKSDWPGFAALFELTPFQQHAIYDSIRLGGVHRLPGWAGETYEVKRVY